MTGGCAKRHSLTAVSWPAWALLQTSQPGQPGSLPIGRVKRRPSSLVGRAANRGCPSGCQREDNLKSNSSSSSSDAARLSRAASPAGVNRLTHRSNSPGMGEVCIWRGFDNLSNKDKFCASEPSKHLKGCLTPCVNYVS